MNGSVVEDPYGQIIHGDCVEVLKRYAPAWADLVLTGPSVYGSGEERRERELAWLRAMRYALNPKGIVALVGPWNFVWSVGPLLGEVRLSPQLVKRVTAHGTHANYSSQAVMVAVVTDEVGPGPVADFHSHFGGLTQPSWSSSFHLELAERLVETYCPENGVVLDPFAGWGTVPVAAENMGREWVGCEREESQINHAWIRIEQEREKRNALQA